MRLTDVTIRSLKTPETGATVYWDDMLPGFGVRVSQAGTKSFVLTHGRTRTRETIGRVGIVSLQDARRAAKELMAGYTLGKRKVASVSWTFAVQAYLDEVKAKRRESTHYEYERVLKRHFRFGEMKMDEISAEDLQRKIDRASGSEKFHAYVSLRAFIRWCHRRHYMDANPMERIASPEGSKARERFLTDTELAAVWNAAGEDTFGSIVKLLILTGQRVGEISKLTYEMVQPDKLVIPARLCKNGREHHVPIGPLAQTILSTRPKQALLFPAKSSRNKDISGSFNGFSKCKAALNERCGVTGWTLHDLRRTFASGMASLGVSLPVIEKMLNHVSGTFGGIVGVYQRYDFMPEMREAMAKWDEHIRNLVAGG